MEVTKKDVKKLFKVRENNSFLNHFLNILKRDFEAKGEIGKDKIKVWQQNFWNTTFYPIFILEFNAHNHLTNIKDEMNPVGKTIIGLLLLSFFYFIFPNNLSNFDFIDRFNEQIF